MKRKRATEFMATAVIESLAAELEVALIDLAVLEAMQEMIRKRQREQREQRELGSRKSLYSDNKRRFVENEKSYRFPAVSYKLPANDDGINVQERILYQLAMPS